MSGKESERGHLTPKSYKTHSDSGSSRTTKPSSRRSNRNTAHYLTYYQSSLADGRTDSSDPESAKSPHFSRHLSLSSTSSSDSFDSVANNSRTTDPNLSDISSAGRLRQGMLSDGGFDRRRVAIVEMDAVDKKSVVKPLIPGKSDEKGAIRSRQGLPPNLAGLALVAPPDAAPKSYSHLSPPTTAPLTSDGNIHGGERDHSHRPSTSEVVGPRSMRDLSREATARTAPPLRESVMHNNVEHPVTSPSFSRRQKPSPTPIVVSHAPDEARDLLSPQHAGTPVREGGHQPLITTPEIGEQKDIGTRVAAPVVISLESAEPIRRKKGLKSETSPVSSTPARPITSPVFPPNNPVSHPHYTPGRSIPPPRAMFNIDIKSPAPPRPPRFQSPTSMRMKSDIEVVKQALQLPSSVTAVLATRSPKTSSTKLLESPKVETKLIDPTKDDQALPSSNSELNHIKSGHRREGAYPSSDVTASPTLMNINTSVADVPTSALKVVVDASRNDQLISDDEVPSITLEHPVRHKGEHQRNGIMTDEMTPMPFKRQTFGGVLPDTSSQSHQYMRYTAETPSSPPKSARNSLTRSLRRLSALPRTPSSSSKSGGRSSSETHDSSRTPSPSPHPAVLPPPRPKIRSQYPAAMFCLDISTRKTSQERSFLYAQKINELYTYDSGLGDWATETRRRATANRPTIAVSAHAIIPQPRHTSGASMMSQATFPLRPDASTATDLSIKTQDLIPTTPPDLPYPSLATPHLLPLRSSSSLGSGASPSVRSYTSSSPSSKSGGFFSSLSRKTSISSGKKDKSATLPQPTTSQGSTKLVKNPPRIVNISKTPSVPGGPRAAPNHRGLRSQTLITTVTPFSQTPPAERNDAMVRRPSLSNAPELLDLGADPDFVHQVDKLADLLPHADRNILSGYLRRAGQDVLAIGQYLEDEKNGTIKV